MASVILIYTGVITNRRKYAIETFCSFIGNVDVKITDNKDEFISFSGTKLNYSSDTFYNHTQIIPHALLTETGIRNVDIKPGKWEGEFCFFETGSGNFPFDIFASSFYLLSRYEEYFSFQPDEHSRYSGKNSLLYKNGVLMHPVIDQWVKIFAYKLGLKNDLSVKKILTIDVDNALAFAHKDFVRSVGGAGRNVLKGGFSLVPDRVKVLRGKKQDPYDTYDYIFETAKKYQTELKFFILLGDPKGYDTNMPHTNIGLRERVKYISNHAEFGIHPSYASFLNPEKVKNEILRLEDITGKKISISRQHFLRMQIPKSYEVLLQCGITDDYTMGFADEPGYRAGTSRSFYWYDLNSEKITSLKIHPFVMMDGTLKRYLKLTPEKSIEYSREIFQRIKNTGGVFTLLWHNESVNDYWKWKGWKRVFEEQMRMTNDQ